LTLALLLFPLTDRAQQSSPASKPQTPTPAQSTPPKQDPAQKSDEKLISIVNLVDVLFTVLNRRNKLVPELEKATSRFGTISRRRQSVISASRQICRCASACCWTLPTAFATVSS